MASAPNPIRRCTKPGCTNKTRGSRARLSEYPTTLIRMKGGVCTDCYQLKEMLCKGCRRKIRPTSIPVAVAPGTVSRHKDGMCKPCWLTANPDSSGEAACQVTEEGLEYTIRGLESFLGRRRERIERFAA